MPFMCQISLRALSILSLAALAFGQNVTSSSHPPLLPRDDRTGFQVGPTTRSSFSIIWSCLAVVFSCTYVAQHPDISDLEGTFLQKFGRKLGETMMSILLPEGLAGMAVTQFFCAKKGVKRIKTFQSQKMGTLDPLPWTMSHAFLAEMGGYILRCADGTLVTPSSSNDFYTLIEAGHIDLPALSAVYINDKSKADPLAKLFVCLQAGWFVIQLVARTVVGFPICQLELSTTAYVALALVSYSFWFHKPYNVHVPIRVDCPRIASNLEYSDIVDALSRRSKDSSATDHWGYAFSACAFIFSTIHLAGWNLHFSSGDQFIWRIEIAILAGTPFVSTLMTYLVDRGGQRARRIGRWTNYFMVGIYVVPHFFLLAGGFSLFFNGLPADVYKTPRWLNYIPHLA